MIAGRLPGGAALPCEIEDSIRPHDFRLRHRTYECHDLRVLCTYQVDLSRDWSDRAYRQRQELGPVPWPARRESPRRPCFVRQTTLLHQLPLTWTRLSFSAWWRDVSAKPSSDIETPPSFNSLGAAQAPGSIGHVTQLTHFEKSEACQISGP